MSIRHIDARFALPFPVERAIVLGGLDAWRVGFEEAGVEVKEYLAANEVPQLVVAPPGLAADAAAMGAEAVVIEGRGGAKPLRKGGLSVQRLVPTPSITTPRQLIRTDHAKAAVYAVEHASTPTLWWKRLRNRTAARFLSQRRFPEVVPVFAVGTREPAGPFFLTAAVELGIPLDAEWYMTLGEIDPLSRSAFHVFAPGAAEPSWIVKLARVPGYTAPFDRDERGLRLVGSLGEVVRRHAPQLLGRLEVGGFHASVESAVIGYSLSRFLERDAPREEKLETIDAVAQWILKLGRRTSNSPGALQDERARLASEVVPRWATFGIPSSIVDRLPPVKAVLQHADMGTWNVITRSPAEFAVIDWESVRERGLPLWDLTFFLSDALIRLDGVSGREERDRYTVQLFRGELPSSEVLFQWLRRAVRDFDVPADAVSPIVTLCWLHHGVADVSRNEARRELGAGERWGEIEAERVAHLWVSEPGLGVGWDAWRRS